MSDNPLNAQQIAWLRDAKLTLEKQRKRLDDAKSAGIDIRAEEEIYNQQKAQVEKLLKVYGSTG